MEWPTASCTHRISGHLVLTAKVVLAPPSPRYPRPSILSGVQMVEPSPCRPASTFRETGQCILIRAALHGGRNFKWDIGVDTLNKWGDLAVKRTLPTLIRFLMPQTTPSPLQLARESDSSLHPPRRWNQPLASPHLTGLVLLPPLSLHYDMCSTQTRPQLQTAGRPLVLASH